MKKLLCGLLAGIIIGTGTSVFAYNTQIIEAVFGKVNLVVNGNAVDKETLLYNGTTYVPLRAAGEALGMAVTYDAQTSTAYIGDVPQTTSSIPKYAEANWAPDFGAITGYSLINKRDVSDANNPFSYAYIYEIPYDFDTKDFEDIGYYLIENGFNFDKSEDIKTSYFMKDNMLYLINFDFENSRVGVVITSR